MKHKWAQYSASIKIPEMPFVQTFQPKWYVRWFGIRVKHGYIFRKKFIKTHESLLDMIKRTEKEMIDQIAGDVFNLRGKK